jgi:hypothetical protein
MTEVTHLSWGYEWDRPDRIETVRHVGYAFAVD